MKTCTKCGFTKKLDEFHIRVYSPDGRETRCKECLSKKNSVWAKENPEKKLAKDRRNRPHYSERARERHLMKNYGISVADKIAMISRQGNKCPICLSDIELANGRVDHNHITGEIRGILCSKCNTGIGQLRDSPVIILSAFKYLTERVIQ